DNAIALPATITAQLTWNGTTQAAQNFSTTGHSPGELLTIAQQVSSAVTQTGRYPWSLQVTMNYGTPITRTVSGNSFVVVNNNPTSGGQNPLGTGWGLSHVDRLLDIAADANGPAGQLRVYGSGGWRFYQGTSGTLTSPPGDTGTLVKNADNSFTYTIPDGSKWQFNSAGMQTALVSPDGFATITFTYTDADGDGQTDDVSTQVNPDGSTAT